LWRGCLSCPNFEPKGGNPIAPVLTPSGSVCLGSSISTTHPGFIQRVFTRSAPIPPKAGPEKLQCRAAFIQCQRDVVLLRHRCLCLCAESNLVFARLQPSPGIPPGHSVAQCPILPHDSSFLRPAFARVQQNSASHALTSPRLPDPLCRIGDASPSLGALRCESVEVHPETNAD
jgi:hypothetical protein